MNDDYRVIVVTLTYHSLTCVYRSVWGSSLFIQSVVQFNRQSVLVTTNRQIWRLSIQTASFVSVTDLGVLSTCGGRSVRAAAVTRRVASRSAVVC